MELLGWVPSALPVTTGSASRVSGKTLPAKGGGCRQGHASRTPHLEEGRRGGGPAEALSQCPSLRCWRAPPGARASRKGGQGESLPRAGRAPKELLGHCTQGGPVTGGVSAWSSWALSRRQPSWAAQCLLGGHSSRRLVLGAPQPPSAGAPPLHPGPRGGLATVRALPRQLAGHHPGPPSRSAAPHALPLRSEHQHRRPTWVCPPPTAGDPKQAPQPL